MEQSNNPFSYVNFETNFTSEKVPRYPSLFPFSKAIKAFWFFFPFHYRKSNEALDIVRGKWEDEGAK